LGIHSLKVVNTMTRTTNDRLDTHAESKKIEPRKVGRAPVRADAAMSQST
jgi:hypothetical protein